MDQGISVLHVDDDADFAELTATFLEREVASIEVRTATGASEALERLEERPVDCIVSDYDMPGRSGLDLLEAVRSAHPELPFILFTGKGSEEIAGDAISAGVTDYLQKGPGSEAYELLANRIRNAVERRRARTNYREIMEKVPDGVVVHEPADGEFVDMNQQFAALFGYDRSELLDRGFGAIHTDEEPYTVDRARELVRNAVETGPQTFRWPGLGKDGDVCWFEVHLRPARLDGQVRLLGVVRDVSARRERKEDLEYERDRLEALFASVPEPIVHVSVEQGEARIVQFNDAFSEVFGYDDEADVGDSLDDLIVPERLDAEARDLNEQTIGADLIEREVVREAQDGQRRFLFKAAPIVQTDDAVEWVGTYVDLSARK